MTKISYECDGKSATVEVKGNSQDIFKGLCRIAVACKQKMEIKDEKTFEELLLKGMKIAETEKKLDDAMNGFDLNELLDLLKELLND